MRYRGKTDRNLNAKISDFLSVACFPIPCHFRLAGPAHCPARREVTGPGPGPVCMLTIWLSGNPCITHHSSVTMPIIARQRQEENRVKRSGEQHSKNSVKVAAFQMKKANIRTKDICEQLGVPKRTFCDWVRQAKDAGTWLDIPGRVL